MTSSSSMSSTAQTSIQFPLILSSQAYAWRCLLGSRRKLGMEFPAIGTRRRRQLALQEIVLIAELAQECRQHLAIAGPDRRVCRRQVVLDHRMEARQRMVGHHREHVVFDVIVHVPVDEA